MNNTAQRADPFASLGDDLSDFAPVAPAARRPEPAAVREIAEKHNFPSRAPKAAKPAASEPPAAPEKPKREQRRYRTGRNVQLNIKASSETVDELTRISNERGWVFGETLAHALAALKAQQGKPPAS